MEALVKSVHREYRRLERECEALEGQLAAARGGGQAEDEVRSDGWLRTLLDNIKEAIFSVEPNGTIRSVNLTGERMFDTPAESLIGQSLQDILELPDGRRIRRLLVDLARERETTRLDLAPTACIGRRPDGREVPVDMVVSSTEIDGRPVFIVSLRDMTERREAEKAILESEARYRALVDSAPQAITLLDPDAGVFVDANGNALKLLGLSREALLNMGPADISPERQPGGDLSAERAASYVAEALAGGSPLFEWTHQGADGRPIPCEVRLARVDCGARGLVCGTIIDIRDRKRAERRAAGERQVLERMANNAPLPEVLGAVADTVAEIIDGACPALYVLEHGESELEMAAFTRLPDDFVAAARRIGMDSFAADGDEIAADEDTAALEETLCVADFGTAAAWAPHRELAMKHGLKGCWSTAIRDPEGRPLGAFAVYTAHEGGTITRHFELVDRMTQLAGIAIERHRGEQALRASEARYRGLFENTLDGVYQVDAQSRFISVNPALVQMLGYDSEEELKALPSTEELYCDPGDRRRLVRSLNEKGDLRNAELRLRRKDGHEIVVLENARAVFDAQGNLLGHEGTLSDITERKRAEMAEQEAKGRALVTLQSIADGVVTTDAAGNVDYMNPVAELLTGWRLADAVGRPVGEIIAIRNEDTGEPMENPVCVTLHTGEVTELGEHSVLMSRNGREIPIQDSAAPIRDRAGRLVGAVLVIHDVSKERQLRRQLAHHATHDSLTGLINRREFETRLVEALEVARCGKQHVLLYIDLDQFKVVNDTCGHGAGDHLLRQVTALIRGRVRSSDIVSRLGGDEFGVLLEDCGVERAVEIADDLRASIRDYRFVWKDAAFDIGASIGLVAVTEESPSIESLLSAADVACYAAKDGGRNRIHIYQQGDAAERHAEMQWVSRVTRALEDGRMELYFQPIVPIDGNPDRRGHYELLVRMRDENGRPVPPSAFIPAAERYNVMPMIDRWVISHALEHLVFRRGDGDRDDGYSLAINLSGTSLNDDSFLDFVLDEMKRHQPAPGSICFEITETAAISNLARAAHFMNELKAQGCEFSLDDFGSGLSSFTYLKNLPVDYVKIDGHFIRNVAADHVNQCMVDSIKRVGNAMGIRTIAEHVEDRETLEILESIGVQYAQGYHIAAPAPVSRFPRFARNGERPLLKLA
jgi:diguanylate cyclase (GGDEF)-like protein/PAS domain S-box-containing protein